MEPGIRDGGKKSAGRVFSSRCVSVPEASASAVLWAQAALQPGFLDLTLSNPTRAGIHYEHAALRAAFAFADWAEYAPDARGQLRARTAVAAHFLSANPLRRGAAPQPSQVVLTASTSEAYGNLFKILCDAGDSVLVPEPSYPLFAELARYDSVKLVPYSLIYDGAWSMDVASLQRQRRADTRAIIVVSPNNPTGNCLKSEELRALRALDLPLIADEVFGGYTAGKIDGACSVWDASNAGLVFVLDGLSKWAGLPQCKLAWTVVGGEPGLVQAALEQLDYVADAYLSPNGLVQAVLPELLTASGPTHDAIVARISVNLKQLEQQLADSSLTPLHYEGGWSASVRLPHIMEEEAWLCRFLQLGVGVQPGWYYDFDFGPVVVLSLLTPEAIFAAGVARMVKEVERESTGGALIT